VQIISIAFEFRLRHDTDGQVEVAPAPPPYPAPPFPAISQHLSIRDSGLDRNSDCLAIELDETCSAVIRFLEGDGRLGIDVLTFDAGAPSPPPCAARCPKSISKRSPMPPSPNIASKSSRVACRPRVPEPPAYLDQSKPPGCPPDSDSVSSLRRTDHTSCAFPDRSGLRLLR